VGPSTSHNRTGSMTCYRDSFHSLTNEAEPFLRSCQLGNHSRTSQRCMGPEGLLPPSQEPSTGPYHEPDRSNPHHPISLRSILILSTPTSWSSQWSLSFWVSHQYPICIPLLPHSCYRDRFTFSFYLMSLLQKNTFELVPLGIMFLQQRHSKFIVDN
jgi:hypothetical protein